MDEMLSLEPIKYTDTVLQQKVSELSKKLCATITSEDCVMYACILKGGVVFFSDLIRQLPPGYTEYISASSYDDQGYRGQLTIHSLPDPNQLPEITKIFLIDDICDSGITLRDISDRLKQMFPSAEVLKVVLIQKAKSSNPADFYAISDDTKDFIYGYGMDRANGTYRNLSDIRIMER